MSLDFSLCGPVEIKECVCRCGHVHDAPRPTLFSGNLTHNLTGMAREAGIYEVLWEPLENGYQTANQIIPKLEAGIAKLKAEPERFKKLNPPNGWGSYDGLIEVVSKYLAACREFPGSKIDTWR